MSEQNGVTVRPAPAALFERYEWLAAKATSSPMDHPAEQRRARISDVREDG